MKRVLNLNSSTPSRKHGSSKLYEQEILEVTGLPPARALELVRNRKILALKALQLWELDMRASSK